MREFKTHPKRPPMQQSTKREIEATETHGHPALSMSGVVPVRTVTDEWETSQPNPDATEPGSLPWGVARALDGKDHSHDKALVDHVGEVLDARTAEANRKHSH